MFIIEICGGSYKHRIPVMLVSFHFIINIQTSLITALHLLELTAKPQSTISYDRLLLSNNGRSSRANLLGIGRPKRACISTY
jgi:hypothetical protein